MQYRLANRLLFHALATVLLAACTAEGDSRQASSERDSGIVIPQGLRQYVPLVEKCHRYHDQTDAEFVWTERYRQDFDDENTADDDGTIKLHAVAPNHVALALGPHVQGDFAIQFRAKVISARAHHLSICTDSIESAPAFLFGGHGNTITEAITGVDANGDAIRKRADQFHRIQVREWHTVRMEIRANQLAGIVDGQIAIRTTLDATYDRSKNRQPLIYIFDSEVLVDQFLVQTGALPDELYLRDAWQLVFGGKKLEEVEEELSALARSLGDRDPAVRTAAHAMLRRAGVVAARPLRTIASNGNLEARERSASLLAELPPPTSSDAK